MNVRHSAALNKIVASNRRRNIEKNGLLRADDIAKIFGTQDNFNMIKSLLHSQENFNRKTPSTKVPSATTADLKVEAALIELQDLKKEIVS